MLKQTFFGVCSHYTSDSGTAEKLWQEIEAGYSKRNRHYHNLLHLESLLKYLIFLRPEIRYWEAMIFALAYHDIVYDAMKSDNEEKSAAYARESLHKLGCPEATIEQVCDLILKTKGHSKSEDPDTNIFLDADLSILGSDPETYRKYSHQIRKEYKFVPDFMYRPGRKKVLENFLKMPAVYKTPFFQELEENAKFNLREELKSLE